MSASRVFAVITHRRPDETGPVLRELVAMAREAGVELLLDREEASKHGLEAAPGVRVADSDPDGVELCVVLGGDGTILRALRRWGRDVPVIAINFGEVGFLATIDREGATEGLRRAIAGDFELMELPGIALELAGESEVAINDISLHRRVGERVAELAYDIDDVEVGCVRCDGLVVATPAGSTGYNLANGGPVLAWGVEGFVVSFIAPHTLTARALVVAPVDVITIYNRSWAPVDATVDGQPVGEVAPGESVRGRFVQHAGSLAQLPGSSFYRRLRDKFGRLSR
ncbi:MAG TPA: NAD(+)/NADH kinase [Solirubrobacteraceae bacterium]|nr:NAD(+)/NADH kinase [Solirubrobacteraceae bacterium]